MPDCDLTFQGFRLILLPYVLAEEPNFFPFHLASFDYESYEFADFPEYCFDVLLSNLKNDPLP